MKEDRSVILLGAGATIPWGGKTSVELTNAVIKTDYSTYQLRNSDECLGYALRRMLSEYYKIDQELINFEEVLARVYELSKNMDITS